MGVKWTRKKVTSLNVWTFFVKQNWTVYDFLLDFQFRSEMLDTLYAYAKFQYECGNYSGAAEYLYFHRVLVSLKCNYISLDCKSDNINTPLCT